MARLIEGTTVYEAGVGEYVSDYHFVVSLMNDANNDLETLKGALKGQLAQRPLESWDEMERRWYQFMGAC